ncbi:MAG: hypothetical protein ACI83B_002131 [Sediminicola sp.]|jgi:hypothetical protein
MKNNLLYFALCITLSVFLQDDLGTMDDYFTYLFFGNAITESENGSKINGGAVRGSVGRSLF